MTNPEFSDIDFDTDALNALDGDQSILLTGNAGTGKSTLLTHWIRTRRPDVALLAPTGIAALNIGGETIHHYLHLSVGTTITQAATKADDLTTARRSLYQHTTTIIIDEISMCRADLLDLLDTFLRHARHNPNPFGGIRIIMVGDLLQLPPVVTREEARLFNHGEYDSPWMFDSHVWRRLTDRLHIINLTETHRQTDPAFIHTLDHIRQGRPDRNDLTRLTRLVGPADPNAITLTATRRRVDHINHMMLDRLSGDPIEYVADMDGDWNHHTTPAPERLLLKPDTRIMMTANDSDGLWANGSTGIIHGFDDDDRPIITLDNGVDIAVGIHEWHVKRNYAWHDADGWHMGQKTIGTYRQLPLRPGWAITIHKSQGLTLDAVNLALDDRPLFAPGMGYVALSRARDPEHVHLNRSLTIHDLKADRRALAWMHTII